MTPADTVFLAATAFGLLMAVAFYLFARSIGRQYQPAKTSPEAASKEEAPNPFDRDAAVTRSAKELVRAVVRAAEKRGAAVDMHIPTNAQFAPQQENVSESV